MICHSRIFLWVQIGLEWWILVRLAFVATGGVHNVLLDSPAALRPFFVSTATIA